MEKFEYPIYKQSQHSGIVVKFENLNCGKVVYQGASNFEVGYFGSHWEKHTNLNWIDVTHIYKEKTEIPPLEMCGTPFSVEEKGHNNGGSTDYYKLKTTWKDLADIMEDRRMNYNQGNIFKSAFCFNVGRHDGTSYERELNKIIYFAERELKRIKNVEA